MTAMKEVVDRVTKAVSQEEVTLKSDECNRPETTLEGLAKLKPVRGEDQFITAGNASQLSDGASACVMMSGEEAARLGLTPLGIFRGYATAGCEPDEMGIGPVYAIPRLLQRKGLTIEDIDLWELNEAFASQVLYCRDKLGIPDERLNVDGGSIAIGHPYGMSGSRMAGHALIEGGAAGVPSSPWSPCASAAARGLPDCSRSFTSGWLMGCPSAAHHAAAQEGSRPWISASPPKSAPSEPRCAISSAPRSPPKSAKRPARASTCPRPICRRRSER